MLPDATDETAERIASTRQYCAQQNVEDAISRARVAHELLDEIIGFLKPGVRESEVKRFALDLFTKRGIERTWHPPHVRFGEHTLLTFMDKAAEDKVLQENDIAFVDIGIVQGGIEGDAGRTVVFGQNAEYEKVARASKRIFDEAVDFWKEVNPSGVQLYEYIYGLVLKFEVKWNLDPAGHLIGMFPHRGWKRGINHFPEKVENGKWILEIQVRHPALPFGAFFEDLLYLR